jgi:pyruvate/2-oxoglutarate/acetoin dehydrogenase E1 component
VGTVSVTKISHRDAITEALRIEMGRDPTVIWVSSADSGSAMVDGLELLFDAVRFVSLDPAERTAIGIAVGMALEGSRPVCEVAATELPSRGLDQLAEAAELHRREGIPVPIVVRLPYGPATADGLLDPDGPERWLLSVPGLTVVAPATGADAKGLLVSAIRDPSPVCFLEQVGLYGDVGPVPEGGHLVPIGKARLVREGSRATLIAHGSAVAPATDAADELDAGIEVLDLRTLAPLDRDSILNSARRTGKALLVEETAHFSAVARTAMATIWDGAFGCLNAPLRRVSLAAAAPEPGERHRSRVAAIKEACDELLAH